MSTKILGYDKELSESGQFIEAEYLIVLEIPSENMDVPTWLLPRASNMTSDHDAARRNITVAPLSRRELADMEASKREMASGESQSFDSLDEAFSWLDAD